MCRPHSAPKQAQIVRFCLPRFLEGVVDFLDYVKLFAQSLERSDLLSPATLQCTPSDLCARRSSMAKATGLKTSFDQSEVTG
mmetsp:Transcript_32387/g.60979  ORF Transcript_32387/g.60979 Transcript_32387/m.60979 type:complete len:82 (+) Transcript_32387:798-1043(+)